MNERITQLVEQARKYASEYVEDEVEMQFHKKFAELIIQECVWQVVKDDQVPYDIQILVGERIKQHFGV